MRNLHTPLTSNKGQIPIQKNVYRHVNKAEDSSRYSCEVLRVRALTFLGALRDDAVNFVGVRNVQLAPVHQLLEVVALVEGAAQPRLPGRRVRLVDALPKLAFEERPGLRAQAC